MNTPTDMFEELREILPPFLRPTTDREDVAALAALSRWRNKARENAHAEAIRACAKATGRTFVPPERATDLDVVVDAIRSVEQDTAARVTAEMLALVCKAEQDERARIAKLWRAVDDATWIVPCDEIEALEAALAPDPVQVRAPALEAADDALERAARLFESDAANDEEKASQVVALRSESSEGTAATLLYCARQSRLSAARVRSLKGAP